MKKILALTLALVLALSLCACGGGNADTTTTDNGDAADTATVEIPPVEDLTGTDTSAIPGVEDGVLTVGMECTYAPYNWTQTDDSNGAVPIVNNPGSYANGYDVMIAQRICDTYGWKLEVQAIEWAGLIPALNAGTIDAVIAGQSMTAERMEQVDMAGPYFYASIVCVAKKDSEQAKAKGIKFLLPIDTVCADSFSNDAKRMVVSTMNIPDDYEGMDIGPDTTKTFCDAVRGAGTVVWNGPMGVFEFENFAAGTRAMAQALADSGAVTIVGGGDSAAAVEQMGFADKITHISTGGGASLEFLEGLELPGVACLLDK